MSPLRWVRGIADLPSPLSGLRPLLTELRPPPEAGWRTSGAWPRLVRPTFLVTAVPLRPRSGDGGRGVWGLGAAVSAADLSVSGCCHEGSRTLRPPLVPSLNPLLVRLIRNDF
ncbi:hypothetical protein chiPu_0008627 [Chiloscyllium punctatum]|uniref:Uncharacterized protein n=1 Tax=Chiloscyllium punctatum TaxID=137246 RepID=A0A401SID7_CHIPU|nr:hypothetical protein [Chiloscyllium punctatum]